MTERQHHGGAAVMFEEPTNVTDRDGFDRYATLRLGPT